MSIWSAVRQGDVAAVHAFLRISEHRMRLCGILQPTGPIWLCKQGVSADRLNPSNRTVLRAFLHPRIVVCWQSAGNRRRSGAPGRRLCWWA